MYKYEIHLYNPYNQLTIKNVECLTLPTPYF